MAKPQNIAHIVRAQREGGPTVDEAAQLLQNWQDTGVLERDTEPAVYHYKITWGPEDARRTMTGLVCRIAIDSDYEHIRRHEKTLKRKQADRLALRQAIGCDPEPIWMLYRDERGWVDEILSSNAYDKMLQTVDEEGSEHTLWRVNRREAIDEVIAQFDERTVVIADGHHRYQTAVNHYAATGKPEHASILVCLVRDTDPGLDLIGTHRLIKGKQLPDFATACQQMGAQPLSASSGDAARDAETWGAAMDSDHVVLLGLVGGTVHAAKVALGPEPGARVQSLTVQRAHQQILQNCLGIPVDQPEDHLKFSRDAADTVAQVRDGAYPLALLLPAEDVRAVLEVATDGDVMPQKSTYFIPKLRSGMLLSPLDEDKPKAWQDVAGGPGRADFRLPPL